VARRIAATALLLLALTVPAACGRGTPHGSTPGTTVSGGSAGAPAGGPPATPSPARAARPDHVVVAVFENKSYAQIKDNPQAPYLNALMARSAVFADAHGVAHPSQPNYLALFSGSTQGVTDDHCVGDLGARPNLARQLLDSGHSFVGYAEDLPSPGYRGCATGRYAAKHNPWADFANVPDTADQPASAWPADLSRLPTVAFVVPNMCNDMHDCGISVGDAWAKAHLDPYAQWAAQHNSLLIVTFDENDNSPGNQILTLVAGAGVTTAVRTGRVDHHAVLRTIEDFYGLAPLGNAAQAAPFTDVVR